MSNARAAELERHGKSVIVICGDCGEQVWTDGATYISGKDEWYCADCDEDLLDEMFGGEELVGDGGPEADGDE